MYMYIHTGQYILERFTSIATPLSLVSILVIITEYSHQLLSKMIFKFHVLTITNYNPTDKILVIRVIDQDNIFYWMLGSFHFEHIF